MIASLPYRLNRTQRAISWTPYPDDEQGDLTRRTLLQGLAVLGIGTATFRRALAAQAAQAGAVTPEMIKQAEWIAGLDLTDEERASAARTITTKPRARSPSCARSTSATTFRRP